MSQAEWRLSAKHKVERYIERLPKHESERIWYSLAQVLDFVEREKPWEEGIDIKALHGRMKGAYRLRVGKLRLIIEIDYNEMLIQVLDIETRGDIYK